MCNECKDAAATKIAEDRYKYVDDPRVAARDPTVGEFLDRRIKEYERTAHELRSLKNGMSLDMLNNNARMYSSIFK